MRKMKEMITDATRKIGDTIANREELISTGIAFSIFTCVVGLLVLSSIAAIGSINAHQEVKQESNIEVNVERYSIAEKLEEERTIAVQKRKDSIVEYKVLGPVNLRTEPSLEKGQATVIKLLPIGSKLDIVNVENEWAETYDREFVHINHIAESSKYDDAKKKYDGKRLPKQESPQAPKKKPVSRGGYTSSRPVVGNYTINSNIYVPSGETVESLNNKLSNKSYRGLQPLVPGAISLEQRTGISAHITLAVAAHESGWGKYLSNTNNYYGLKGRGGWMSFSSPDGSIEVFGKSIMSYNKNTLAGINPIYAPPNPEWKGAVVSIANSIKNN